MPRLLCALCPANRHTSGRTFSLLPVTSMSCMRIMCQLRMQLGQAILLHLQSVVVCSLLVPCHALAQDLQSNLWVHALRARVPRVVALQVQTRALVTDMRQDGNGRSHIVQKGQITSTRDENYGVQTIGHSSRKRWMQVVHKEHTSEQNTKKHLRNHKQRSCKNRAAALGAVSVQQSAIEQQHHIGAHIKLNLNTLNFQLTWGTECSGHRPPAQASGSAGSR